MFDDLKQTPDLENSLHTTQETIRTLVLDQARKMGGIKRVWTWILDITGVLQRRIRKLVQVALDSYKLQLVQANERIPEGYESFFSEREIALFVDRTTNRRIVSPQTSERGSSNQWENYVSQEVKRMAKLQTKSGPLFSATRVFRSEKEEKGEIPALLGFLKKLNTLEIKPGECIEDVFTFEEKGIIQTICVLKAQKKRELFINELIELRDSIAPIVE